MTVDYSGIFYRGHETWKVINEICSSHQNILVASPYISDKVQFSWKSGDVLLVALSETNVRKGFVNPNSLEGLINLGVRIYSNEKLHAKIYFTQEQAFICSCNLSYASQNEWLEAGVLVKDPETLVTVMKFFDENLTDLNVVSLERVKYLKTIFEVNLDNAKQLINRLEFPSNVWSVFLTPGETMDESLEKLIKDSISQIEIQKDTYSYYHFRNQKNEFRIGDFIIQFQEIEGKMRVYFPSICIGLAKITDTLFIIHLSHEGFYEALEWDKIKSSFIGSELRPQFKKIDTHQKVLENLYLHFHKGTSGTHSI